MLVVIRIRRGAWRKVEDTLKMLKVNKKYTCVLVPETSEFVGMINKVKDYVTWGKISEDVLKKLIEKRGRIKGNKKIDKEFLKERKIKSIEELAKKVIENKIKLKDVGIKSYFRLSPPSKGFKGSVKQPYPRGALGNRGEKINELLKRMI